MTKNNMEGQINMFDYFENESAGFYDFNYRMFDSACNNYDKLGKDGFNAALNHINNVNNCHIEEKKSNCNIVLYALIGFGVATAVGVAGGYAYKKYIA